MTRDQALPYVGWIADDAGSFRKPSDLPCDGLTCAYLIGWQCGFEPMFVACKSYLPDVRLDVKEALLMAMRGLKDIDWFGGRQRNPDYIIEPPADQE